MLTRLILWMIDKADEAVCRSAGEEDLLEYIRDVEAGLDRLWERYWEEVS